MENFRKVIKEIKEKFWTNRSKVQKILLAIMLVLFATICAYLIWRIVYAIRDRDGNKTTTPPPSTTKKPGDDDGGGNTTPDNGPEIEPEPEPPKSPDQMTIDELQQNYTRHRFPYIAIIRLEGQNDKIKCLGVVVKKTNILTLGTCVEDYLTTKYETVVGKYLLGVDEKSEVVNKVGNVEFHPFFKRDPQKYNLALITTETLPYSTKVCKAHLNYEYSVAGKVFVHGWHERPENPSPMKTTTFVLTKDYCDDRNPPICKGKIKPKFDKYCVGMLGSPIVIEDYPRQVLLGLSNVEGYPCNEKGSPTMIKIDAHTYPFDIPY